MLHHQKGALAGLQTHWACRMHTGPSFGVSYEGPGKAGAVQRSMPMGTAWRGLRVGLGSAVLTASLCPQDATCVPTTATASAPCMARCTPCGAWWAQAARPQPPRRPRSLNGCGTFRVRSASAPAPCLAWPTASALRSASSRAPGSGPSRASCCCRRRSKREPSGTLSTSGK